MVTKGQFRVVIALGLGRGGGGVVQVTPTQYLIYRYVLPKGWHTFHAWLKRGNFWWLLA